MLTRLVLLLALVPAMAFAAGAAWRSYVNSRFGVLVEYPAFFTNCDPAPENGDGQVFRTASGNSSLRVYGSYSVDKSSALRALIVNSVCSGVAGARLPRLERRPKSNMAMLRAGRNDRRGGVGVEPGAHYVYLSRDQQ